MNVYRELLEGGFAPDDISRYMRSRFKEGGYSDQEIGEYINANTAALFKEDGKREAVAPPDAITPWEAYRDLTPLAQSFEEAGKDSFFVHGLQSSVSGLYLREQLPDAVSPEKLEAADWKDRLSLSIGQTIGDIPTIVGGGALGAIRGGPAAPVTMFAGAMALTEGFRASYMDRIANGHTEDFFYLGGLWDTMKAAGKGGVIGAATGGAGMLAKAGAAALGASAPLASTAGVAAEVMTMPSAAGAIEGRLPHPQEFVDAAMFIGLMRGVNGIRHIPAIVPKLRDIYVKLGKGPEEVARAAQADQTVLQDILSENVTIPGAFAEATLNRLKAGEEVPTEELQGYRDHAWAQAILNERAGPEAVKSQLEALADKAVRGEGSSDRTAWGFIGENEAALLAEQTQLDIQSGYSHTVDVSAMRHALNKHGSPQIEIPRGQLPITVDDLVRIPEIVRSAERVIHAGTNNLGNDIIRYEKTLNRETILVVEEVRAKRNQLAFQTMWKRKADEPASPPSHTSETLRGMNTTNDMENRPFGLSDVENIAFPENVNPEVLSRQGFSTQVPVDPNKRPTRR
ncbi:MAG: hypothetical protein LBU06_05720 [Desulfovibrio sp.]|jgi:hypothetical protein|nr:hypothetical protein [Desulfovibrio sp.]